MKKLILGIACSILLIPLALSAQRLSNQFEVTEYIEMLRIAQFQAYDVDKWDSIHKVSPPSYFKQAYRSPVIGLDNIWDLWVADVSDSYFKTKEYKVAVISVRGTTAEQASWLANFYAAMVPASGTLDIERNFKFNYHLSDDSKAGVHVGWLLAMAYLSRDILPKIDSCYKAGYKDFILTGHSQGAGITFLLTSHLRNLQQQGKLPTDIQFKTYCSAAPKPGNLFYAYSYEHATRDGWGYTVVNTADWVPEVPFSIQTVDDFNHTNIFKNAKGMIKQQKFPKNLVLKYVYGRLSKPAIKARKNYTKYLGKMTSKMVQKELPEFKPPTYFKSNNYARTGTMIVLRPNAEYYKIFPDMSDDIWTHHFIEPYLYLMLHYEEL